MSKKLARRQCVRCYLWKTERHFLGKRGRICTWCRKENRRVAARKRRYGITQEHYDLLMEFQQGGCAICKGKRTYPLHVDHDHKTGLVRGLLCKGCNKMLGKIGDDPEVAWAAYRFLKFPTTAKMGVKWKVN